jgi:hypothetical protein
MTNLQQLIEQMQEEAREEVFKQWPYTAEFDKEVVYPWIDQIISQTVERTVEAVVEGCEKLPRRSTVIVEQTEKGIFKSYTVALSDIHSLRTELLPNKR